jgi:hypothetical protein
MALLVQHPSFVALLRQQSSMSPPSSSTGSGLVFFLLPRHIEKALAGEEA